MHMVLVFIAMGIAAILGLCFCSPASNIRTVVGIHTYISLKTAFYLSHIIDGSIVLWWYNLPRALPFWIILFDIQYNFTQNPDILFQTKWGSGAPPFFRDIFNLLISSIYGGGLPDYTWWLVGTCVSLLFHYVIKVFSAKFKKVSSLLLHSVKLTARFYPIFPVSFLCGYLCSIVLDFFFFF